MNQEVDYSAVNKNDSQTDRCCIAHFFITPYTIQVEMIFEDQNISASDLVAETNYLTPFIYNIKCLFETTLIKNICVPPTDCSSRHRK